MEEKSISREKYIQTVLDAYRQTPGTTGMVRRPDRLLAEQLYGRGVPLCTVENALVLAASRRLIRPADAIPLTTIRSLAYFSPVIEEVLGSPVSPEYYRYLRHKIQRPSDRDGPLILPEEHPPDPTHRARGADDVNPTRTLSRG